MRTKTAAVFGLLALACATHLRPGESEISAGAIPRIDATGSVAVRAAHAGAGERALPGPGVDVVVDDAEFAAELASRLSKQLQQNGVRIEADAERTIEIQVVRVSLHPEPTFTCVIDFNRRLGDAAVRGFQSRATNWNFERSCAAAVSQAVVDLLNDPSTLAYLEQK